MHVQSTFRKPLIITCIERVLAYHVLWSSYSCSFLQESADKDQKKALAKLRYAQHMFLFTVQSLHVRVLYMHLHLQLQHRSAGNPTSPRGSRPLPPERSATQHEGVRALRVVCSRAQQGVHRDGAKDSPVGVSRLLQRLRQTGAVLWMHSGTESTAVSKNTT